MRGSYYDVLGVVPSSSEEEIRARYLWLIRRYHPDLNRSPLAHARTAEINEAYRFLSNASLRAAHNAQLAGKRQDIVTARAIGFSRHAVRPRRGRPRRRSLVRRNAARLTFVALLAGAGLAGWQIERNLLGANAAQSAIGRDEVNEDGRRAVAALAAASQREANAMPPISKAAVARGASAFRQSRNASWPQLRAVSERCHVQAADRAAWDELDTCAAFDQAAFLKAGTSASSDAAYFIDAHDRAAHFYVAKLSSVDAIEQRLSQIRAHVGRGGKPARSGTARVLHGISKRGGHLADAVRDFFDPDEPAKAPTGRAHDF